MRDRGSQLNVMHDFACAVWLAAVYVTSSCETEALNWTLLWALTHDVWWKICGGLA